MPSARMPSARTALRRDRYVLQFQLGVLELERTRRAQEYLAARRKIEEIEQRLRQLDALIRERQDTLDRGRRLEQF